MRLVIALVGQGLGGLHRLLRLDGQLVEPHHVLSWRSCLSSANSSFSFGEAPGTRHLHAHELVPGAPALEMRHAVPGMRKTRPLDVSAGIFIATLPLSVGMEISAPSAASTKGTGTST